MCWVKHAGIANWTLVRLTFPITFEQILFITSGNEDSAVTDYTTTATMSGRGASRYGYYALTNTSVQVQAADDVYIVIFGI